MQRQVDVDLMRSQVKLGRRITAENYTSPEVQAILTENKALSNAMGHKRALSHRMSRTQRTSVMGGGGGSAMGGDVLNAIPRFYDPLEYWDLSGLPWSGIRHRHPLIRRHDSGQELAYRVRRCRWIRCDPCCRDRHDTSSVD